MENFTFLHFFRVKILGLKKCEKYYCEKFLALNISVKNAVDRGPFVK